MSTAIGLKGEERRAIIRLETAQRYGAIAVAMLSRTVDDILDEIDRRCLEADRWVGEGGASGCLGCFQSE